MEIATKFKKWFRSSLLAEYLPLCLVVLALFFFFPASKSVSTNKEEQDSTASTTEYAYNYDMPALDVPLRYFPKENVAWSAADFSVVDAGYNSFPTTEIILSLDSFSNVNEPLPPILTPEEIKKEIETLADRFTSSKEERMAEIERWTKAHEDEIQHSGVLANRFFGYSIDTDRFDVDRDGTDELIVMLCGKWGNHCPHKILIVKDGYVIFSVEAGINSFHVTKSSTGNGFYVEWVPSGDAGKKWDVGLCCPPGYIKTRFVFEDNKFVPVYEQEILYVRINDTE